MASATLTEKVQTPRGLVERPVRVGCGRRAQWNGRGDDPQEHPGELADPRSGTAVPALQLRGRAQELTRALNSPRFGRR
jgi:hypothetical protein